MIGFELNINSELRRASLENGIVSINVNRIKTIEQDKIDLSFGGYNPDTDENYKWVETPLKIGDKIIIEIKDIEDNSTAIEVKKRIPTDTIIEGKLRAYNALKRELEEEGLI
ncbi:MAG: hypothetical protein ACI83W_001501 [Marinoscillum sp.]|jgi:hypothetical protein